MDGGLIDNCYSAQSLLLNVAETGEMVITSERGGRPQSLNILREVIEVLEDYKCLGMHIDSRLN